MSLRRETQYVNNLGASDPNFELIGIPGTADKRAIPLCLPNNCQWNSESSEYIITREKRSSLYVVEEALEKLRKVKGLLLFLNLQFWPKLSGYLDFFYLKT